MSIRCFVSKQAVVEAYFSFQCMWDGDPVQRPFYFAFAGFGTASTFGIRIVGTVNFNHFSIGIFDDCFCFDDVGVFEAHFSSQFQTEEFLVGLLSKIFLLDVYFFRKRHFSSTCIWIFWVVFCENPFLLSFGIVGDDQFQRI